MNDKVFSLKINIESYFMLKIYFSLGFYSSRMQLEQIGGISKKDLGNLNCDLWIGFKDRSLEKI